MLSNLNNRQKRYLFFWLWIFVSKVSAVLILGLRYDLFSNETSTGIKLTMFGMILVIWAVMTFWHHLFEWTKDLPEGLFKGVMSATSEVFLPLAFWLAGILAKMFITQYLFFVGTILVTTAVGVVLRGYHIKYKRKILIEEQHYVNTFK